MKKKLKFLSILLLCSFVSLTAQPEDIEAAQNCKKEWKYKPLKKETKIKALLSTGKIQYGSNVYPNLVLGISENGDTIVALDLDYWGPIRSGELLTIVPRKWSKEEKKYRPNLALNSKHPEYTRLYCVVENAFFCQFKKENLKPKEGPSTIADCTPENKGFNESDSIIYQVIDDYYLIEIKTKFGEVFLDRKYDCSTPTRLTPSYLWSNEKVLCLQSVCPMHEDKGLFCAKQIYLKIQDGFKVLNRENVITTDEKNNLIAYAKQLEEGTFLIVENLITEEKQKYALGKIPCPFINNCLQEIKFENGVLTGNQVIQQEISIEIEVLKE